MTALYNEIDGYAARWMQNLIAAGHVAPGVVDARSITELQPEDVRDATQAHFFAGIAVWSAALRAAGWPDDVPIWTGSCPCQPFSQAGRGAGVDDERHLWPAWFRLIRECHPPIVVGEQVASPAGLGWLDAVLADLESAGYACAAVDFCAASVGAPHMRQRLYFVAVASERFEGVQLHIREWGSRSGVPEAGRGSKARNVADAMPTGRTEGRSWTGNGSPTWGGGAVKLGNARGSRSGRNAGTVLGAQGQGSSERGGTRGEPDVAVVASADGNCAMAHANVAHALDGDQPRGWRLVQPAPHATDGFWSPADWILCSDGKARPVEPGTFPLAHGASARVGRLRAYGNAIVRPQAQAFIEAVMEILGGEAVS